MQTNIFSPKIAYQSYVTTLFFQKQPSRGVLKQIYRRIYMPKFDFNKAAKHFKSHFEIALWRVCSPIKFTVNLQHLFLRTPLEGCFCFFNWSCIISPIFLANFMLFSFLLQHKTSSISKISNERMSRSMYIQTISRFSFILIYLFRSSPS